MNTPPDLLPEIRRDPEAFLGLRSLTGLWHFHGGYQTALADLGVHHDPAAGEPFSFPAWVAYRLHYGSSGRGHRRLILVACGDESTAFTRFFELLDEYHRRKPKVLATVSGVNFFRWSKESPPADPKAVKTMEALADFSHLGDSEKAELQANLSRLLDDWRRQLHAAPTKTVTLITYTDDPGFFLLDAGHRELGEFFPTYEDFEFSLHEDRIELTIVDQLAWNRMAAFWEASEESYNDYTEEKFEAALGKYPVFLPMKCEAEGKPLYPRKRPPFLSQLLHPDQKAIRRCIRRYPALFLERIRCKPGLYIGEKTLTGLYFNMLGYQHALVRQGIAANRGWAPPEGFSAWVAERLGPADAGIGWQNLILQNSANEEEAFDRFFELHDAYRAGVLP